MTVHPVVRAVAVLTDAQNSGAGYCTDWANIVTKAQTFDETISELDVANQLLSRHDYGQLTVTMERNTIVSARYDGALIRWENGNVAIFVAGNGEPASYPPLDDLSAFTIEVVS